MQTVALHIEYAAYNTWFRGISNNPPPGVSNSYGETTESWYRHEGFVTQWALDVTISYFHLQSGDVINIEVASNGRMTETGVDWSPYSQYKITYNGACIPVWKCEQPLNGYEFDGCGNRRLNTACNPLCQSPLISLTLT